MNHPLANAAALPACRADVAQAGRWNSVHLDVDVLIRPPEQLVANPAANYERASSFTLDALGDLSGGLEAHVRELSVLRLPYFRTRRSVNRGAMAFKTVSPRDAACG